MRDIDGTVALARTARNKGARFPNILDERYQGIAAGKAGFVKPYVAPRFRIQPGDKIFTIGSCFARETEGYFLEYGCRVPVREFSIPEGELPLGHEASHLLNEYTAGAICQRILAAFGEFSYAYNGGLEMADGGFRDLLLQHNAAPVSLERLMERRAEIDALYRQLRESDAVVITLGLIESWFERDSGLYLNRTPSLYSVRKNSDKYGFRVLDYPDSLDLIDQTVSCLVRHGIGKILMTVSPVALLTSFTGEDVIVANSYSKSVLRCVAEQMKEKYPEVDYFPSYEIATSFGLAGYKEDNFHLHPFAIQQIMESMRAAYFEK